MKNMVIAALALLVAGPAVAQGHRRHRQSQGRITMSDNPSAFPTHDQTPTTDPRERILQGGMTLRDYFASKAIAHGIEWCERNETGGYADAAAIAYQIADAMLAARTGDA